jgi:hypothetical protein
MPNERYDHELQHRIAGVRHVGIIIFPPPSNKSCRRQAIVRPRLWLLVAVTRGIYIAHVAILQISTQRIGLSIVQRKQDRYGTYMISTSRRLDTTLLSNICRLRPIDSEPTLRKKRSLLLYLQIDLAGFPSYHFRGRGWNFVFFLYHHTHHPGPSWRCIRYIQPVLLRFTRFLCCVCVFFCIPHTKKRSTNTACLALHPLDYI